VGNVQTAPHHPVHARTPQQQPPHIALCSSACTHTQSESTCNICCLHTLRAQVNASGSAFAAALESLPLDELELGSLRGVLVGAVADVDLAAQTGRLAANLASPRFSGLAGTSLSMNAR
jgi:hypothetical protein